MRARAVSMEAVSSPSAPKICVSSPRITFGIRRAAARPARCAASRRSRPSRGRCRPPAHGTRRASTYGASIQPCALPTIPAAITGTPDAARATRRSFVERRVEAALVSGARQIHDARRRCARVQHRAGGAEQIGAQRRRAPVERDQRGLIEADGGVCAAAASRGGRVRGSGRITSAGMGEPARVIA